MKADRTAYEVLHFYKTELTLWLHLYGLRLHLNAV